MLSRANEGREMCDERFDICGPGKLVLRCEVDPLQVVECVDDAGFGTVLRCYFPCE